MLNRKKVAEKSRICHESSYLVFRRSKRLSQHFVFILNQWFPPCGGSSRLTSTTAPPYVLTLTVSAQKDEVTRTGFCKHVSKPCYRRLSDYSSVEVIQTLSLWENVARSDNVISIHVSYLHERSLNYQ